MPFGIGFFAVAGALAALFGYAPPGVSSTATNYRKINLIAGTSATLSATHADTTNTGGHSSTTKMYQIQGQLGNNQSQTAYRKSFTFATETSGTLSNSIRQSIFPSGLSNQGTAGYIMGGDEDTNVGSAYAYRTKQSHSTETETQLTDMSNYLTLSNPFGFSRTGIAGYLWSGYTTGVNILSNPIKQNFSTDVSSSVTSGITLNYPYGSKACNPSSAGYLVSSNESPRKFTFSNETGSVLSGNTFSNFENAFNVASDAGYFVGRSGSQKFSFATETLSTWGPGGIGGNETTYHGMVGDGN